MNFTQQQQDAIDARGRSVIVSAAAGSGKTAVLVQRLIKIICDSENRVPVERMAVVTFTKAAAAEMKQRLMTSLSKELAQNSGNYWAARQKALLDSASICTIDSFSTSLIREHIAATPLGADFRIAEETEINIFSDTVMKELMDSLYADCPDDLKLLHDSFCGNSDQKLTELIKELHRSIRTIPFYESRLDKFIELYDSDVYISKLSERFEKLISGYEAAARGCFTASDQAGDVQLAAATQSDLKTFTQILDTLRSGQICDAVKAAMETGLEAFPRNKKDVPDPDLRAEIKDIRAEYYDSKKIRNVSDYKSLVYAKQDLEAHKKIMTVLSKVILKYDKMLFEYKVSKNAIGFDDEERIALELLGETDESGRIVRTKLGEEISGSYDVIMIDEFQDTNDRQDMIFRLLSKNGSADNYGSNLFFVGDVKQSIYRFRLANPENFINAQKRAVPYKAGETANCAITLNKNFRSSPEVIGFINFVFENIMSESCGDIDYNDDHRLVNGLGFCESSRETVVNLIDRKEDGKDAEAYAVAHKIRQMIDEKVPVSTDGGKSSRPCEMKDFCILIRSKKKNSIYEAALKKYGLEVNCSDVSGYLGSKEISVLINLLRVVDDPLLDIPLASVMMSPMFMFTADDMVKIRLVNKKARLYSNICAISENSSENSADYSEGEYREIREKTIDLLNFIADLRLRTSFCSLPELIRYIYDRTDFTYVVRFHKNADRKRANLRLLLEYADKFRAVSSGGVSGFVKYIDMVIKTGGDFEGSDFGDSGRNAVAVMTMHKSKGLEFPFVFLAETSSKFNRRDSIQNYQFSADLGIGFRLQNKENYEKYTTLPYEVIAARNELKSKSEEMRLMYVAMTRAKEKLFLTLDVSETAVKRMCRMAESIYRHKGITPELSQTAVCMGDWIAMALLLHKSGSPLREKCGLFQSYCTGGELAISFDEPDIDITSQGSTRQQASDSKKADTALMDRLRQNFAFRYDRRLVEKTSKFSVSDISKNDGQVNLILSRPAFAREEKLDAAERGTAMHCFLQFADFSRLRDGFEEERERLISYGHITPKQAQSVHKEDIEAFLDSETYKAVMNAKNVIRERKFLISLEELDMKDDLDIDYEGTDGMLTGIMDMVVENDDSLILVDYKTDKTDSAEKLRRRYSKQLLLYKKALEIMQDKPVVKALIYSFYQKRDIEISL